LIQKCLDFLSGCGRGIIHDIMRKDPPRCEDDGDLDVLPVTGPAPRNACISRA
jgi:hypothetical protein